MTTTQIIIILLLLFPFLLAQATWIFRDAKKRGERCYWLWGFFGLLHIPESLIIYLIVTRVILGKYQKKP